MAEPLNAKSYYIFGAHFFCLKILTKISYENIFFKKKKTCCRELLWEVPPMTRSRRKYQAGKAIWDPIHYEVMRKKSDRQGHLG